MNISNGSWGTRRMAGALLAVFLLAVLVHYRGGLARAAFPGANGRIVFVSDRDGNEEIYVMDADGGNPTRLTDYFSRDYDPAWSPDGSKIVFSRTIFLDPEIVVADIFVMNSDGSDQTPVTAGADTHSLNPNWSPDGSRIVFTRGMEEATLEIWVMDADGGNAIALTDDDTYDGESAWSPDGTKIAYASDSDGNPEIFVMDVDGNNKVNLSQNPALDGFPAWSPDGTQIAFVSYREGEFGVYIMNADGTNQVKLAEDRTISAWSPDGLKLLSVSTDDSHDIYIMDANGENPVNLTNNEFADDRPDWQPLLEIGENGYYVPMVAGSEPSRK